MFCVVICQPLFFSFSICHWIACSSSVYGFMPCCMMYFTGNDDYPLHRTDTVFCPRLWVVLQFIRPMQGCRIRELGGMQALPIHTFFEDDPNSSPPFLRLSNGINWLRCGRVVRCRGETKSPFLFPEVTKETRYLQMYYCSSVGSNSNKVSADNATDTIRWATLKKDTKVVIRSRKSKKGQRGKQWSIKR